MMEANANFHVDVNPTKPTYTILFFDGSVGYAADKNVFAYTQVPGNDDNLKNSNWTDFEWVLETLEAAR